MSGTALLLITGDCGDYYCEGTHPLGIASTPEAAEKIADEARAATWTNRYGSSGPRWVEVSIEEYPVDELAVHARSHTYD